MPADGTPESTAQPLALQELLRNGFPGFSMQPLQAGARCCGPARSPGSAPALLAACGSCLQPLRPPSLAPPPPGAFPATALLSPCLQGAGCKDMGLKVGSVQGPQPEVLVPGLEM